MPIFIPTHASTAAMVQPRCSKCSAIMTPARIMPGGAGHQGIFECPACDDLEVVVQFH
jgi:hypothetical protein